jgi:CHAD domain-containing protein
MSEHENAPACSPVKAAPPGWSGKQLRAMDGQALLRRMVDACLAQIRPNAGALAQGGDDPEHVHQLRVGLRRLRSAAGAMRPFGAGLPPGWEAAVQPVFDALGESRDRHVQSTTLAPELAAAGAPLADLGPPSAATATGLARLVRGSRFQDALSALSSFAETPDAGTGTASGDGLAYLAARLHKLSRQVMRGARRFDALPFEDQHQVRKRLKSLRYLAEFAAPAFKRADVKAWMKAQSAAQDALGTHIDRVLAARRFAALSATDPRAWFAAGWLRAKSERSARESRELLDRLREVDAFW